MSIYVYSEEKWEHVEMFDEEYEKYIKTNKKNIWLVLDNKKSNNFQTNHVNLVQEYDNTEDFKNALIAWTWVGVLSILWYWIYKIDEIIERIKEETMSLIPHPHISLPSLESMSYIEAVPFWIIWTYLLYHIITTYFENLYNEREKKIIDKQMVGHKKAVQLHKEWLELLNSGDMKWAVEKNFEKAIIQKENGLHLTIKSYNNNGDEIRSPVFLHERPWWHHIEAMFLWYREIKKISSLEWDYSDHKNKISENSSKLKTRIIFALIIWWAYTYIIN